MTVPTTSTFPEVFDTDSNLFFVRDGLRVKLTEDYNPGDTSITVDDVAMLTIFPETGIITLTEQCSDIDKRALSFYYTEIDTTNGTIGGLELRDGFVDCIKPKGITDVTINVVDLHHNNLVETLKNIQSFCGVEGTLDVMPFGQTLEGRINFLRKIVLVPKAWFTVDKNLGIVPMPVTFTDRSFRLGTDGTAGEVIITWDFGDGTITTDAGPITHTYQSPGIYTVRMTARNDFGEDTLVLDDYITVRTKAPDEAKMQFIANTGTQRVLVGDTPRIRSPINTLIQVEVQSGEDFAKPGYSYAGEPLNDLNVAIDPISNWTWAAADDLIHSNSQQANLSYGIGGFYDLKLRADTTFGAYRITTYEAAVDAVENVNMWLWTISETPDPDDDSHYYNINSYEYGLISETFKLTNQGNYTISRNNSFLDAVGDTIRQKSEFRKNVAFNPRSTSWSSDLSASAMLFWATGRNVESSVAEENIAMVDFNGFTGTYTSQGGIDRAWNWCHLGSSGNSNFFGGETSSSPLPNESPVNTTVNKISLTVPVLQSTTILGDADYLNGASDLQSNPVIYDEEGLSVYGHHSTYRSTWKDSTGYIVRNDAPGLFFRLKSFYRTQGTISDPFQHIEKMQDVQGPTKLEGELTNLSGGVYFFNNSGGVSAFDPITTIWKQGGPGINSAIYRSLQDTTVDNYDDPGNTLYVTSDGNNRAYLSFDYSTSVFIKFNEINTSFSALGSRPSGEQFLLGIY